MFRAVVIRVSILSFAAACSFSSCATSCGLQAKAMLAAIERNSAFVGRARDAASFSPKDLAATDEFLTKERTARKVWIATAILSIFSVLFGTS